MLAYLKKLSSLFPSKQHDQNNYAKNNIALNAIVISSIDTDPPYILNTYNGVIHPKSIEQDRAALSMNSIILDIKNSCPI